MIFGFGIGKFLEAAVGRSYVALVPKSELLQEEGNLNMLPSLYLSVCLSDTLCFSQKSE